MSSQKDEVRCVSPKEFFFVPDFGSSLLYYDEAGMPKRYAPIKKLPNGEWMYCLSPFRNNPPLSKKALLDHIERIKEIKHGQL